MLRFFDISNVIERSYKSPSIFLLQKKHTAPNKDDMIRSRASRLDGLMIEKKQCELSNGHHNTKLLKRNSLTKTKPEIAPKEEHQSSPDKMRSKATPTDDVIEGNDEGIKNDQRKRTEKYQKQNKREDDLVLEDTYDTPLDVANAETAPLNSGHSETNRGTNGIRYGISEKEITQQQRWLLNGCAPFDRFHEDAEDGESDFKQNRKETNANSDHHASAKSFDHESQGNIYVDVDSLEYFKQ